MNMDHGRQHNNVRRWSDVRGQWKYFYGTTTNMRIIQAEKCHTLSVRFQQLLSGAPEFFVSKIAWNFWCCKTSNRRREHWNISEVKSYYLVQVDSHPATRENWDWVAASPLRSAALGLNVRKKRTIKDRQKLVTKPTLRGWWSWWWWCWDCNTGGPVGGASSSCLSTMAGSTLFRQTNLVRQLLSLS